MGDEGVSACFPCCWRAEGGSAGLLLPGGSSLCQLCPFPVGPGVKKHREGRSETRVGRSRGPPTCPKATSALQNERFLQPVVKDVQ